MYDLNSNILQKTGVSAADLNTAMRKIRADHLLKPALEAIVKAEKEHGISAVFITAHAALETGWGHSTIAKTKNNLFGFNAVDSNPGNANRYKQQSESVEHYAQFLSDNYLHKGGKYYNGATPHGIMIRYASAGDKAARTIADIMNMLTEHIDVPKTKEPDGFPEKTPKPVQKNDTEVENDEEQPEPQPETSGSNAESIGSDESKKNSNSNPHETA